MNYYKAALNKYAVFSGRSRRAEYWYFVLFNIIISILLSIVDSILGLNVDDSTGVLSGLYGLAVLIPSLALCVRRLHDIGKSGWWLLILLIPVIGMLIILYFVLKDSQPGMNQYGPNPKEAKELPSENNFAQPTSTVTPPSAPTSNLS